ncbi:acyl-coenzyme A thioesterase 13-like isoform X3 [Bolinopsis microptera]|uniref:acyl-coenzyme A thioesterase 13-like isoform X3 n=1 Tax=Bolinopsis microptera TaxID=2820187 RepID=UPI003078DD35
MYYFMPLISAMSLKSALGKHLVNGILTNGGFSQKTMSHLKLADAIPGTVKFNLTVEKGDSNIYDTMHGGLGASLVDLCSSVAILSKCKRWGVSTDMQVSYLKGAPVGKDITIVGQCDRAGKTLAFSSCFIYNEKGDLLLKGQHTKFMGTPLVELELDD